LVRIAAAIVRQNHGGTIVVDRGLRDDVEPQPHAVFSPPSVLLRAASDAWASAYDGWRTMLEAPHSGRVAAQATDARWTAWNEYADAIEWVATLATVDGAVLLSRDDLAVLAFGAHLKENAPLTEVQLLDPNPAGGVPTVTAVPVAELGGTRHRSAVHWVNAAPSDRLAVVASHDGLVSLVVPIADGVGVVRPMPLLER
jgi:hypothetical protein